MQFSPHHCGYFEALHGRLHCGNFAVFVYLSDVDVGDGGLLVVRSTTALCNRSTDSKQATIFCLRLGAMPLPPTHRARLCRVEIAASAISL